MARTIKKSDLQKLVGLIRSYDPYTMYIDNYKDEQLAKKNNKSVVKKFSDIVNKYTGANYLHTVCFNGTYYGVSNEELTKRVIDYLGRVYDEVHKND